MTDPDARPGLNRERTALSWRRTGLSAGLVCLVLAIALVRLELAYLAVGAACLGIATAVIAMRRFPYGEQVPRTSAWPALTRITAVVVAVALLGVGAATLIALR